MLSVYSRHYPPCKSDDINYKRCRCPKWINGVLGSDGPFVPLVQSLLVPRSFPTVIPVRSDTFRKVNPNGRKRLLRHDSVAIYRISISRSVTYVTAITDLTRFVGIG